MSAPTHTTAAGYIAAVVTADDDLIRDYREAFNDTELLDAMSAPLRLLVHSFCFATGALPSEVVDRMVKTFLRLAVPPTE